MKKRILVFSLVVLQVLSLFPTRTVSAAYSYDPAKAAAWAKVKANVQNTSGQCATFVSRCLREGGLGDVKFSTPGAMVEHLEKKGYGTTYKLNDESLAKLKAGDVIAVFCSKKHDSSKYWGIHTIFVTEVNQAEKYIRYSARNNNHYNEKVSFSWLKNPGNYSANCAKCGHKKNNYAVIVSMKDTSTPESKYLNQCTFYSSSTDLTMVNSGYMKSLPCSKNTNEASKDVVWITKGTVFKGVELFKNTAGNYWYKANYDGKTGYVYAGDVSAKETFSVSITGVTAPTGNREKGKALTLKGVVNAGTLKITKLAAKIYKDTDRSLSNPLTGTEISPNTSSYSIQGSALDNNCALGSLDKGAYNYVIYCVVENHITTSGTELKKVTRTYKSLDKKELYVSSFTVAGGTPTATYSVSYNANGGSGAPGGQTKVQGQNLALSSTKPTRTGYTFQGWATSSGGAVTYQPGSTYSNNAAVTLYAIWKADSYTVSYNANGGSGAPGNQTKTYGQNLTLSGIKPTRGSDYTFKGWATSAGGNVAYQPGSTYSSNASMTLYAVWEKKTPSAASITLQMGTANGKKGDTVRIPVEVKNNPGFTGMTFGLQYDTSKLELLEVEDAAVSDWYLSGTGMIGCILMKNYYGNGVIVKLKFKILQSFSGSTAINFKDVLVDKDELDLKTELRGGSVSGYLPGDINGDLKVNIHDVVRLLKYSLGEKVQTFANKDVNGDSKVNIHDVVRLLKYVLGEKVNIQ